VSLAKKIVVTHCERAVYTALVSVHGTYTAVYTVRHGPYAARSRPCTPPLQGRVRAIYTAVYTAVVYMAGRTTGPCTRSQTARYGRVRPVTTVYTARSQPIHCSVNGRVRRPYGRYTAVRHVHTSTPQLKGRAASTQSCTWQVGLHGRVHGPRRHVTAVGRVHGCNAPCTRLCTRPIHSPVHVRLHGPCARSRTRTVCRNGPHTAVACRLGTCIRSGRPTCRIHGPCTVLVHGRVHGPLHGRVRAM